MTARAWTDTEGGIYRQNYDHGPIYGPDGHLIAIGDCSAEWIVCNEQWLKPTTVDEDGEPDQTNYAGGTTQEWDAVSRPKHYTLGGIECIDAIAAATTGLTGEEAFCTGNAIKYLWRWKHKNGAEDLRKACWYIERLIAAKEKATQNQPASAKVVGQSNVCD